MGEARHATCHHQSLTEPEGDALAVMMSCTTRDMLYADKIIGY